MGSAAKQELRKVLTATIEPDNDLLESIKEIAKNEGISAGIILSAAGSLKRANLRNVKVVPEHFPIKDIHRLWKVVDDRPLEILSLSGNISKKNGGVEIHAHITVSTTINGKIVVLGGHLVEGNITYVMVEIAIAELKGIKMIRALHPERKAWELTFG